MKDFVSSHRISVFSVVAAVSVVWVICSILVPHWLPWMGLWWVGLALSAALWRMGTSSDRSIAQILRDADAQPVPAKATRSGRLPAPTILALVAASILLPALALGATPDSTNLSACRSGFSACDRSRLTLLEISELALEARARNVSNCRNGLTPCQQDKLSKAEAIAVSVALYDRNVSNCRGGFNPCDHAQLTPSEARDTALAEHQRPALRLQGWNRILRPLQAHRAGGRRRRCAACVVAPSPIARAASAAATVRS